MMNVLTNDIVIEPKDRSTLIESSALDYARDGLALNEWLGLTRGTMIATFLAYEAASELALAAKRRSRR